MTTMTMESAAQIRYIAKRYTDICAKYDAPVDTTDAALMLAQYHLREAINLDRLAAADDTTLAHDVGGIIRAVVQPQSAHARTFMPRCGFEETTTKEAM